MAVELPTQFLTDRYFKFKTHAHTHTHTRTHAHAHALEKKGHRSATR